MFFGQFDHTLDAKQRLTLPARYRERFSGPLVLSPGMDGCIAVYPQREWERFVEDRLAHLDPLSRTARLMTRHLFGRAVEDTPDRQGRVQVPGHLAQHAGLERKVVVAGVRDHLEIWDAARWKQIVEEADSDAEAVADDIARARAAVPDA